MRFSPAVWDWLDLLVAFNKAIDAKPHSSVYMMHKYFARRPWNVFTELISHYSSPGEIVLDPFCGGGVTVFESLKLKRKAIGVDINPLATYVTEMQSRSLDPQLFREALSNIYRRLGRDIESLYSTKCVRCGVKAVADWIEWDERSKRMIRIKYDCPECKSSQEKPPAQEDVRLAERIERNFTRSIGQRNLWFPKTRIPPGDKTNSLLSQNINYFFELFTKRNLLALAMLRKEIEGLKNGEARDFLEFAFSGSLKWASRHSHLRGQIVEGWAMHAYWIYPKSLEINVWNTFKRRAAAIVRGKSFSNQHIRNFCKFTDDFTDLAGDKATCLVLNRSSERLPFPDNSVDVVLTDPPYGGNVNYAELADYWFIWRSRGRTIEKEDEVIINKTQRKTLNDYERMLHSVFRECCRVLKPGRCLVSTFNSRDLRVVASFVTAVSKAGFTLHPDGLLYQKPIRAYTTTFHAMQIGAFVGDFIFTFVKEEALKSDSMKPAVELAEFKRDMAALVANAVQGGIAEPQVRELAYKKLIPFLGTHARTDLASCAEAVDFFEAKIKEQDLYFRDLRKRATETRRRRYAGTK